MTPGLILGSLAGCGLWLAVVSVPPMRRVRLADRVAPYVDVDLVGRGGSGGPADGLVLVASAMRAELVHVLERILGGRASVRRRLDGLGLADPDHGTGVRSVQRFREEQVAWGAGGLLAGAGVAGLLAAATASADPVAMGAVALGGLVAGVLGRDWALTRSLHRREQRMVAEFPAVADLFALAVTAGEAPVDALGRVCRLASGEVVSDLSTVLARTRSGVGLADALAELSAATTCDALARFADGLAVAVERGTPLTAMVRAQALDVHEAGTRALLEVAGRKEIQMLAPVVFAILPVTVAFALYPGLVTLAVIAH